MNESTSRGFVRDVQLRHLRCLVAVAQERNLARAADRLALSQPAVSKTLVELETLAGQRLVDRGRHGARLTAAGQEMLAHAVRVLEAVGEAGQSLEGGQPSRSARLRIGALPSVASAWLPQALATFFQAQPQVQVSVDTGPNPVLLDELRAGTVDFVLGRMADPQHMDGLSFELLQSEPLALVTRPGHPLAGGGVVTIHAVLDYPLVVYREGTIPRHTTESFLSAWGLKLPLARRLDTLDVALTRLVVRDTDAVWFTPSGAATDDVARGTLVRLPVETQGTEEPVGLLLRSEAELPIHAREFMAQLRALAGRTR